MNLIQIRLPINLVNKLKNNMINEGFENIEAYIEYTLSKSIDNETLLLIFPDVIKKLASIEGGEIFTVIDLIRKDLYEEISITALQEFDALLNLYLLNTDQFNSYQIIMWDPILYINKYIKLN